VKIYVAGHRGMAGSAILRRLRAAGYRDIVARARSELDLTDQRAVFDFLARERPDYVFVAAAKVGGIHANSTRRAEFLYENLAIEANLIHGAYRAGVRRLLFLGSSCIYPRDCPQPIREEYLLAGPLEPTNEPYAVAKIAGLKLCEAYNRQYGTRYCTVMPTNLYGPNDNYDLDGSHVLAALLRKAHEAKLKGSSELAVWGSGRPRREFLHVDDLAQACVFLMERGYDGPLLNVGTGQDLSIAELAAQIMRVVGLQARLRFDASKPDGTPRKLLDISRLQGLGWKARIALPEGLRATYAHFRETRAPLLVSS
jgi:GDP-L-fucose synthase